MRAGLGTLPVLFGLACARPSADPSPPAETSSPTAGADPDDISGPVYDRSQAEVLRFEPLGGADWPTLSSATLDQAEPAYRFALVVLTPSREDSRFYRHQSTLSALFHPHDQAPNLLYVYASATDRLEYPEGRLDYQVDPEGSARLQQQYGNFAVLLLDGQGQVLLESQEPVDRYKLHQAMSFVEGRPHPDDRPPGPPVK